METEVFFTETMGNPKKIGLVDYSERDVSHTAGTGSCSLVERLLANVQGIALEEACDIYRNRITARIPHPPLRGTFPPGEGTELGVRQKGRITCNL